MTKVQIEPGICGFTALVTAHSEDGQEVTVTVESGCKGVQNLVAAMEQPLDAYELCFAKPGENPLYEAAADYMPSHGGCPVIAGITKCVEAECRLALKKNASITFVD